MSSRGKKTSSEKRKEHSHLTEQKHWLIHSVAVFVLEATKQVPCVAAL